MAEMTKEQECDELHRSIWTIADELRGAVDGWNFKNYVLATMFYRDISENLTAYVNSGEYDAGNTGFDYAKLSDAVLIARLLVINLPISLATTLQSNKSIIVQL